MDRSFFATAESDGMLADLVGHHDTTSFADGKKMETRGDDLSTTIVVQHVADTCSLYRATLLGWRREMAAILHLYNAALLSTCVANPHILEDEDSTLTKSENNFGECHPFLVCYCQGSTCCFSVANIHSRDLLCACLHTFVLQPFPLHAALEISAFLTCSLAKSFLGTVVPPSHRRAQSLRTGSWCLRMLSSAMQCICADSWEYTVPAPAMSYAFLTNGVEHIVPAPAVTVECFQRVPAVSITAPAPTVAEYAAPSRCCC